MEDHDERLRTIEDWFGKPEKRRAKMLDRAAWVILAGAASYFLIRIIQAYMAGVFPCPQ